MSAVKDTVLAHCRAVEDFFAAHEADLESLADQLAAAFRSGHKLLVCGNGGSACDAMHIAGEFAGRFVNDRPALPAVALSADTGLITAVGNDYGFDHIFARQVEALGSNGDLLIALSTSGTSPNVVKALEAARARGLHTVLLTGEKGRDSTAADRVLAVPSRVTARIQETHILFLHLLAERVEARLF